MNIEELFRLPFKIKIRFHIFFIVFMGIAFLIGSHYEKSKNIELSESLSKEYVNQLNKNVIEATTSELLPAVQITESSARLLEEGTISYTNIAQMENYLQGALKTYPQLNAIYFGDKFGNFYMVKRLPNGNKQIKVILRSIGVPTQTTKTFTNTGIPVSTEMSAIIDYDPRTRPWFTGAKNLEQRFWTEVYIFYTGNIPGVSAAFPAFDSNKQFLGTFGVDIILKNVSKLLREHKPTSGSRLFILDHNDSIVAHPDMEQKLIQKTDTLNPLRIVDIKDPIITETFKNYQKLNISSYEITYEKTNYIASVQAFPEYFGQKWTSVMIISKKDLNKIISPKKKPRTFKWMFLFFITITYSLIFIWINVFKPLKNGALKHLSSISEIRNHLD